MTTNSYGSFLGGEFEYDFSLKNESIMTQKRFLIILCWSSLVNFIDSNYALTTMM